MKQKNYSLTILSSCCISDVHQIASSADTSPQDEDRGFDISDSESSDEGNLLSNRPNTVQRRGIVNPNYPGFQHLAHTLDYSINKASSDTDFTDDDFECDDPLNSKAIVNNINNNNNNINDDTDEYHIDSVNRLDSVENIQKVFYDKPVVFDIGCEETENQSSGESESISGTSSTQTSDEDTEITVRKFKLNIKLAGDESVLNKATDDNIIGDFGREIEQEFGRISLENSNQSTTAAVQFDCLNDPYELPKIEHQAAVHELQEAVEKLTSDSDIDVQPLATKYNIQPNIEEPLNKLSTDSSTVPLILNDTITMPLLTETITSQFSAADHAIQSKICDAFLSNAREIVPCFVSNSLRHSDNVLKDSNRELEEIECQIKKIKSDTTRLRSSVDEFEKFNKEDLTKDYKEKDEDSAVPRKKEKIDYYVKKRRDYNQQFGSLITFPRREFGGRNRDVLNRRSVPMTRDKKRTSPEVLGKNF